MLLSGLPCGLLYAAVAAAAATGSALAGAIAMAAFAAGTIPALAVVAVAGRAALRRRPAWAAPAGGGAVRSQWRGADGLGGPADGLTGSPLLGGWAAGGGLPAAAKAQAQVAAGAGPEGDRNRLGARLPGRAIRWSIGRGALPRACRRDGGAHPAPPPVPRPLGFSLFSPPPPSLSRGRTGARCAVSGIIATGQVPATILENTPIHAWQATLSVQGA